MQFSNDSLTLKILEQENAYCLESNQLTHTSLKSLFSVLCQTGGLTIDLIPSNIAAQIEEVQDLATPFGKMHGACLTYANSEPETKLFLRLGVLPGESLAMIQIEITNNSNKPFIMGRIFSVQIGAGNLHLGNTDQPNPAFYSHGWQSWSHTAVYGKGEKQRKSILGPFQNPMVVNSGTPQTGNRDHFSGDMFGVLGDRSSRIGLVAGFLSQQNHFGSLEAECSVPPALKLWSNGDQAMLMPGETICTDWAALGFVNLDAPEPLGVYLRSVAKAHPIKQSRPVPVGWCSWYHFYQDISEENILANLESVIQTSAELPLPLFQVDDGFETYPGDWFDFDPAFPNGLTPIVNKTKSANLTPGIWLAPFIVHPKARLPKEHPEWLLRDRRGKPVIAGFVWNAFAYALDLTNPDALEFACSVVRTAVEQWGFEYLKLDFLYAAALDGVYQDPTQTRAQVLRKGLTALREAAGEEVMMLACGCPIGSALGLFDAMRISSDVSGYWKPHFPPVSLLLKKEPHMPSARNALNNILTRAMLHRQWWINDPDCLLVRKDTDLTLAEVHTLATAIGLTGGSLLISDDLPALSPDRMRIAQALLPTIEQPPRIIDWFDRQVPARLRLDFDGPAGAWHLLALFNWNDTPDDLEFNASAFNLPADQAWWLREFWTGTVSQMNPGESSLSKDVPPHGVRVMAVRRQSPDEAVYLGSDLHISQGIEVQSWHENGHKLAVRFKLGRSASGTADIYLPWQPEEAICNRNVCSIEDKGEGVYTVRLDNIEGQTLTLQ